MLNIHNLQIEKINSQCDDFPQLYYLFSFCDKCLYIKKMRSGYALAGFGLGVPVYSQAGCDIYFQHDDLRMVVKRFRQIVYDLMAVYVSDDHINPDDTNRGQCGLSF